ncbi:MAG: MoaF N-terminal domain-containing protein [Treponema sp.]|jgi:hypothetical protein|nr:MoaF N-terminal domain-containing protein [Treponema sp.]
MEDYYGIFAKKPVFEGLSQWRQTPNYELAGRRFELVMDTLPVCRADFLSGTRILWDDGKEVRRAACACAKIDNATYLVNFEYREGTVRVNPCLVLDLEQRLVTLVITQVGYSVKYPTMTGADYYFGAIREEGMPLPSIRHDYTGDFVGKRICWHYSPDFRIIHVYYSSDAIRITFPPEVLRMMRETPVEKLVPDAYDYVVNGYDEPTRYIKIKEKIYLVNSCEQHKGMRALSGNSMLFLMDIERVHDVGRSFGYAGDHKTPENYMFAAHGEFVYSDGGVETHESPYLY